MPKLKLGPAEWLVIIGLIICVLFIFDKTEYPVIDLYEVGPGKPYITIQSAVNALIEAQGGMPFDTEKKIKIYAKQGEGYIACYDETIIISGLKPTQNHRLIIEGDGSLTMIASSQDLRFIRDRKISPIKVCPGAAFTIKSPFVTIRKLRLGGNGYPMHCIEDNGVYVSEKGFVIENCFFYKTHLSSVYLAKGADNAIIRENEFTLSGIGSVEISSGVNNCLIYNNTMVGMRHGIMCKGDNHKIYDNTIIKEGGYAKGSCILLMDKGRIDIKNNILIADSPCSCFGSDSEVGRGNISSDHNLFYTSRGEPSMFNDFRDACPDLRTLREWQATGQDTNSVFGDPMFFSFTGFREMKPYSDSPPFYFDTDLRLRKGSAAIDRGEVLSDIFNTDILGTKRKNLWDIGAYAWRETCVR